ncbi:hypothetical protein D3C83_75380 [compost metagenome]
MKMHLFFFDPLWLLDHKPGRPRCMRVQLAAVKRDVNFRTGKAGDELGLLQAKQIGHHARRDINRMTHRVCAEP